MKNDNKLLKGLLITGFVVILLFISAKMLIPTQEERYNQIHLSQIPAILSEICDHFDDYYAEHKAYPTSLDFIPKEKLDFDLTIYKFVLKKEGNKISQLCTDCGIEKDSFKIMAFANLDDDDDIDAWTVDHEKNISHLQSDIIQE